MIAGYSKQLFSYDALGNIIQTESGMVKALTDSSFYGATQRTQNVYDSLGRNIYTVSADNSVNETRYNALGQVTQQLSYAQNLAAGAAVTVASLTALQDIARDQITTFSYDMLGRVVERFAAKNTNISVQKADGTVEVLAGYNKQKFSYDAFGNQIAVEEGFVKAITDLAFYGVTRKTQQLFDALGREIFTVGPNGAVTETRYNNLGQVEKRSPTSIKWECSLQSLRSH